MILCLSLILKFYEVLELYSGTFFVVVVNYFILICSL